MAVLPDCIVSVVLYKYIDCIGGMVVLVDCIVSVVVVLTDYICVMVVLADCIVSVVVVLTWLCWLTALSVWWYIYIH